MSLFLGRWFGKPIEFLKNKKAKKLAKIEALKKEVQEIEKELARQKEETK